MGMGLSGVSQEQTGGQDLVSRCLQSGGSASPTHVAETLHGLDCHKSAVLAVKPFDYSSKSPGSQLATGLLGQNGDARNGRLHGEPWSLLRHEC